MEKRNGKALLPIVVFVVLYLGLGILFEYGLNIEMGFYKIPVVVIFLVALLVACIQNHELKMNDKLELMGKGISDPNIITMIIIFMLSGIFVGIVGRTSANSVAYFILSLVPPQFAVVVLFVVSCFVSLAMGTSVGTITLIVPIGIAVSSVSGFALPVCIGSVMSGAMFGDNLSFISDTTIAACNGQGCEMKDKFRTNFRIALPAALVTLALILVFSLRSEIGAVEIPEYHLLQTLPYLLVLIGGVAGINVFVVLLTGIFSGAVIMLATGATHPTELLGNMGSGVSIGGGGSMMGDIMGLGVGMAAMGAIAPQIGNMMSGMSPNAVQQPPAPVQPAAEGWTCPSCGKADISFKFCPDCGAKKPEPKPAGGWTCSKCGTENITSKFCPECGTKFGS